MESGATIYSGGEGGVCHPIEVEFYAFVGRQFLDLLRDLRRARAALVDEWNRGYYCSYVQIPGELDDPPYSLVVHVRSASMDRDGGSLVIQKDPGGVGGIEAKVSEAGRDRVPYSSGLDSSVRLVSDHRGCYAMPNGVENAGLRRVQISFSDESGEHELSLAASPRAS